MQQLLFFIVEAFRGIIRSRLMMFTTFLTIAFSLAVFGVFLLVTSNFNHLSESLSSKLELHVFLKSDLTRQDIEDAKTYLSTFQGINSLRYLDKNVSWNTFKKNFPTLELDKWDIQNPLPHSFKVTLTNTKDIQKIAKEIDAQTQYIDEVVYKGALAYKIEQFSNLTKWIGIGLVLFLTLSTLLIIINTLRLTIIARHDEVAIMQLVGATDRFIKMPFLLEGLFLGLFGSLLSIVILKYGYNTIYFYFEQKLPLFPILSNSFHLNMIYGSVIILGTLLGIIGAYISVSRTLKTTLYKS